MEMEDLQSGLSPSVGGGESEAEIRACLMRFSEAVRKGQLDEILSFYTDDVVALDFMPPLSLIGKESYRKNWQMYVENSKFPFGYDFAGLQIKADGTVGFAHALLHLSGDMNDGKSMEMWTQYSAGLVKQNGKWMIQLEHISVPVEMESGKAMFDLKPDGSLLH